MKNSKNNIILKIFGYLFFCAIMYVVTMAWAFGNYMNVKQDKNTTQFGFVFIFSVFAYVSYLFWGKNALLIPVLLVAYFIYSKYVRVAQEQRYLYR
jgi:hypothetical protein